MYKQNTMKKFYLIALALIGFCSITYARLSSPSNGYYEIEVSSFGNYDMSGKTFYILSGNKDVSNKDLEFLCYKDMVAQSLIQKNAILLSNQDSADVCVLMDYGITDKSYVATYSRPLWGLSGIVLSSVATTSGLGFAKTTIMSGSGFDFGIKGTSMHSQKVPEFRRVLNLYAYDNKDRSSEPIMLWKTNLSSDGYLNDLQTVFPYLAEAGVGFIGTKTEGKRGCTILENDIEAYFIKNGYYLNDNVVWFTPHIVESGSDKPMFVHSVLLEEDVTRVNLLAKYHPNKLTVPKFKMTTYVLYKGLKYPIIAVYLPNQTGLVNYINENIYLEDSRTLIQLVFPVKMNKGDVFELVSYFNKKETKEFVRYENIVIE